MRTCAALLMAVFVTVAAAEERGAVALVNGVAIEAQRLERWFEAEYLPARGRSVASIRSPAVYKRLKREALDTLVAEELLWQEARRRGRVASAAEVEAEVARIRAAFATSAELSRWLEKTGIPPERLDDDVRRQLSIRLLVQELHQSPVAVPVEELVADLRTRGDVRVAPWMAAD